VGADNNKSPDYIPEWLRYLLPAEFAPALVAACLGGMISFLLAWKNGQIRNGKFIRKLVIEVVGGGITGMYFSTVVKPEVRWLMAFGSGIAWSRVAILVRQWVTAKVRADLNQTGAVPRSRNKRRK
jgi:hypothetical protein